MHDTTVKNSIAGKAKRSGGTGTPGIDYAAAGMGITPQTTPSGVLDGWLTGASHVVPLGIITISPDLEEVTVRQASLISELGVSFMRTEYR